jgi:hypothetical protein
MKVNDIENISTTLTPQNYENIFNVYEDGDGFYYFNLLRTVNFPTDLDTNSYQLYVTDYGDMWPLIAWKMYRNVKLWWVVCAANGIIDPTVAPKPGTQLKIINRIIIKDLLNQIKE